MSLFFSVASDIKNEEQGQYNVYGNYHTLLSSYILLMLHFMCFCSNQFNLPVAKRHETGFICCGSTCNKL